jgi:hypothetical protein
MVVVLESAATNVARTEVRIKDGRILMLCWKCSVLLRGKKSVADEKKPLETSTAEQAL